LGSVWCEQSGGRVGGGSSVSTRGDYEKIRKGGSSEHTGRSNQKEETAFYIRKAPHGRKKNCVGGEKLKDVGREGKNNRGKFFSEVGKAREGGPALLGERRPQRGEPGVKGRGKNFSMKAGKKKVSIGALPKHAKGNPHIFWPLFFGGKEGLQRGCFDGERKKKKGTIKRSPRENL